MSVGDVIRDARLAQKLSQKSLGRRLRVEGPTISRWETGRTPVPRDQLNRLSNVLGIPVSTLEESMGVNISPLPAETLYVPLVELLTEMSFGEQKKLYDVLDAASRVPARARSSRQPRE